MLRHQTVKVADDKVREQLIDAAREIGKMAVAYADEIERDQKLPRPLIDALANAGLLKMTVPKSLGGGEVDPETFVRVLEEVSRYDGSTGWCVFLPAAVALAAGSFPEDVAWEIFGRDPKAYVVGSYVPARGQPERGPDRAIAVDGGYRVSGRWSFASGCMQATWVVGASPVYDGDTPRIGSNGLPEARWMFFPVDDCQIFDTWHVTGLRGTGSRDFSVADVFVPRERTLPRSFPTSRPHPGALYAFGVGAPAAADLPSFSTSPWRAIGPFGFSSVLLGIGRGAIDAFADLAAVKRPNGGTTLLRDDAVVQTQIGQAEATLRSARAFLLETVREAWQAVLTNGWMTTEQHKLLDLAATHAAVVAAEVVDTVWHAAGTSSIFDGSPLERRFRDVHVGRQNVAISPATFGNAGRMFLHCDAEMARR